MTPDLWTLVATVGLAVLQVTLASIAAKRQTGMRWALSPRDNPIELTGMAARLARAQANLYESLPLFATLVLVAHVAGEADRWTHMGAQLYFWSRLFYVPAYASGLPLLRTAFWTLSIAGLAVVALGLFV